MGKKDEIQAKKQVVSSDGVKGEVRVLCSNDRVEVLLYLRTLSGTLHHTGRDSIMHEGQPVSSQS
jgi:ribosomal 30S subunit maturation factor RimM